MKIFIFALSVLFIMPNLVFSQKFKNTGHQTQYNGKVNFVTRYEYRIDNFDSTEVNAILTKASKTKYIIEYSATNQVRSFKTVSPDYSSTTIFEYDKFGNSLKRIRTIQGTDYPPEIIRYNYDYENKSVLIFKDDKKYKFRQYDEENRIIVEETFIEYSNRKEHTKQKFNYNINGSITIKSYKDGKIRGTGLTTFDSLTQIKTEIFQSPDGKRDSKTITKMDGEEVVNIIYSTNPIDYRTFIFKDENNNTIKRYRYNIEQNSAFVYEYEIDYYKP